jgi:hypothetical protein
MANDGRWPKAVRKRRICGAFSSALGQRDFERSQEVHACRNLLSRDPASACRWRRRPHDERERWLLEATLLERKLIAGRLRLQVPLPQLSDNRSRQAQVTMTKF